MPRIARAVLAVSAACVVALGLVTVGPSLVGAAPHKTSHHKTPHHKKRVSKPPRPVTLAPGAVVRYYNVKIGRKHIVRASLLRFDLRNPRVRLDASLPRGAVGAGRQSIPAQTRRVRAVGGVNADFFNVRESTGAPNGGVVVGGRLYKSPRRDWDANFYVRGGRATIGRLNLVASVTRAARPGRPASPPTSDPSDPSDPTDPPTSGPGPILPGLPLPGSSSTPPSAPPSSPPSSPSPADPGTKASPAATRAVSAVNSLKDLRNDRIVLITPALAAPRFGRNCEVVAGTARAGRGTITAAYHRVRSIPRRTGSGFALVACGNGPRAKWLPRRIIVGDTVTVTTTFAGGMPGTLVSGGRVLVRNGRAYDDSDGKTIRGRNPETFGCVSRSGYQVLLGTIDGRREGSSGVTLSELTRYLLRLKCRTGIVFDGGGSSTLVGRPAGARTLRVLNRPSERHPRAVTTGLVLYRR